MERQRVEQALARIEAAAARIEAAASNRGLTADAGDPLLASKHAQLRASVGSTLKELDVLIGSLENG